MIWFARSEFGLVGHARPQENREHLYRAEQRTSAVGELCGRRGRKACWPVQFARQVQRDNSDRSVMHGNLFLVLRVIFWFVMFSAARSQATSVHHHDHESAPHNTGSRCQSKGSSLLPRW
jgi:hypothetical protein